MKNIVYSFGLVCCFSACQNTSNSNLSSSYLLDSISQLHLSIKSAAIHSKKLKDSLGYWKVYSKPQVELTEKGIENPAMFITNNLLSNQSIIPFKGVLGGNMMIQRVSLLGDHWAIASFEDGHIGGYMLLSFSVKDTTVKWKLLDVNLND